MKVFVAIVLCVLAGAVQGRPGKEENKEMLTNLAKECMSKEKGSEDDFNQMVNKEMPTTKPGKCMHACMMENFGVMSEGKFDHDSFVEIAKLASDNSEKAVNDATDISNECKSITDDDRCELSYKLMECMHAGAQKRGYDIKDF